jgi:cell division initiation protein
MKVTPLDIQQKRFRVVMRGYERSEVEAFLDVVREEMEGLVREVTELREFHETYADRMKEHREREETLKNTMITTHKLAEDIKESSRKEAEARGRAPGAPAEEAPLPAGHEEDDPDAPGDGELRRGCG